MPLDEFHDFLGNHFPNIDLSHVDDIEYLRDDLIQFSRIEKKDDEEKT